MSNLHTLNNEVIDNKAQKRFEIHIDDQVAFEEYEVFYHIHR